MREWSIITSKNHPSNPQQPIHSLLSTGKSLDVLFICSWIPSAFARAQIGFPGLDPIAHFPRGKVSSFDLGGVNCLGHSGGENLRKAIVSHLIDDIPILRHVPPILAKCSFFGHSIFSMLELGAPVHSHLLAKIVYLWFTRGNSSERGSPDHLSFKLSEIHNHQQQVSMCQKELPPFFI